LQFATETLTKLTVANFATVSCFIFHFSFISSIPLFRFTMSSPSFDIFAPAGKAMREEDQEPVIILLAKLFKPETNHAFQKMTIQALCAHDELPVSLTGNSAIVEALLKSLKPGIQSIVDEATANAKEATKLQLDEVKETIKAKTTSDINDKLKTVGYQAYYDKTGAIFIGKALTKNDFIDPNNLISVQDQRKVHFPTKKGEPILDVEGVLPDPDSVADEKLDDPDDDEDLTQLEEPEDDETVVTVRASTRKRSGSKDKKKLTGSAKKKAKHSKVKNSKGKLPLEMRLGQKEVHYKGQIQHYINPLTQTRSEMIAVFCNAYGHVHTRSREADIKDKVKELIVPICNSLLPSFKQLTAQEIEQIETSSYQEDSSYTFI